MSSGDDDDDDPIAAALHARNEARDHDKEERQRKIDEERKRRAAEEQARNAFVATCGKLDETVAAVNKQLKDAGEQDYFRVEWPPNPGIENAGKARLCHHHPNVVGQVSETAIVFGFDGMVRHEYRRGSHRTELDITEGDFLGMDWQALLGAILFEDIDGTK